MMALLVLVVAELEELDPDPLVPHPLSASPTLSAAAIIAGILIFLTDRPLLRISMDISRVRGKVRVGNPIRRLRISDFLMARYGAVACRAAETRDDREAMRV
jgi:hypothetical protein